MDVNRSWISLGTNTTLCEGLLLVTLSCFIGGTYRAYCYEYGLETRYSIFTLVSESTSFKFANKTGFTKRICCCHRKCSGFPNQRRLYVHCKKFKGKYYDIVVRI